MAPLLKYGATGYTGQTISEQARSIGLVFAVAGRTEQKLKSLASRLAVPYHVFDLEEKEILGSILINVFVILNYAGPSWKRAYGTKRTILTSQQGYQATNTRKNTTKTPREPVSCFCPGVVGGHVRLSR